jgi:hypothetical protein
MKVLSKYGTTLSEVQEGAGKTQPCCGQTDTSVNANGENKVATTVPERNLEDVVLIATVIAAGCEPCAEKAVARALEHDFSHRHIQRTLDIIAKIQKLDCFTQALGPDVVARMNRPLAAGRRTLREAILSASR